MIRREPRRAQNVITFFESIPALDLFAQKARFCGNDCVRFAGLINCSNDRVCMLCIGDLFRELFLGEFREGRTSLDGFTFTSNRYFSIYEIT